MCILSIASWGGNRKGTEHILSDCDSSLEVDEEAKHRRGSTDLDLDTRASLIVETAHLLTLTDMVSMESIQAVYSVQIQRH